MEASFDELCELEGHCAGCGSWVPRDEWIEPLPVLNNGHGYRTGATEWEQCGPFGEYASLEFRVRLEDQLAAAQEKWVHLNGLISAQAAALERLQAARTADQQQRVAKPLSGHEERITDA